MNSQYRRLQAMQCLDCLGDRIGNVVQLQVKKDRQIELRHLHHAVMAVGAEEFETELQAADMIFDGVCKVLRFFKVRGIDGDINRAAQTTPGEVVVEIEEDLGGVCVVSEIGSASCRERLCQYV